MRLFQRSWSVVVGTLEVSNLDIEFSVKKTNTPDPNTCELSVYGLSQKSRGIVEMLSKIPGSSAGIPVKISAGYEDATSVIWLGDLRTVESTCTTDGWSTAIGSGDGEVAIQTARINKSFAASTSGATVLDALVSAMKLGSGNVALAKAAILLNPLAGTIASQGIVLSGSAADHMTSITDALGLEWSVQDGAIQFLIKKTPMPGKAVLLSAETGLIEPSPMIDNNGILTCQTLMIPGVAPGTLLALDSRRVKGGFRVLTAEYEGSTSGDAWGIKIEAERY